VRALLPLPRAKAWSWSTHASYGCLCCAAASSGDRAVDLGVKALDSGQSKLPTPPTLRLSKSEGWRRNTTQAHYNRYRALHRRTSRSHVSHETRVHCVRTVQSVLCGPELVVSHRGRTGSGQKTRGGTDRPRAGSLRRNGSVGEECPAEACPRLMCAEESLSTPRLALDPRLDQRVPVQHLSRGGGASRGLRSYHAWSTRRPS
jgi:hypothetical protein